MKKQIKKSTQQQYKHPRLWAWCALIALFICGMMLGLSFSGNPKFSSYINNAHATEQPAPETSKQTCEIIEETLLVRLPHGDETADYENRIERAKIYANLSERGCPENQKKFYDLAKQELDIARALRDDKFNEYDTIEVVETYKRLNMEAAAQEILDTTKKLVNPTIDFILQVEKIINEK